MAKNKKKQGRLVPKTPAPLFIPQKELQVEFSHKLADPLAGRELALELHDVASGGELLARHDGVSFYVDVGCPGQKVLAQVLESGKGVARARRVAVLEPASGPTHKQEEAFCAHFGSCGGCQWQEIPYPRQTQLKQAGLYKCLLNIGEFSPSELDRVMQPMLDSPKTKNFRARMEFAFSLEISGQGNGKPGQVVKGGKISQIGQSRLGLRQRGSHQVVEVENCPVAAAELGEILRVVRKWVKSSGLSAWTPGGTVIDNGILRFLNTRISRASGKIAVELLTFPAPNSSRKIAQLGEILLTLPKVCSFTHMSRESEDFLSIGERIELHLGDKFLREELGRFKYDLAPGVFFQTNIEVAELLQQRLLSLVSKYAGNLNSEAWDLYSGVGALTFPQASFFERIAGFELSDAAVELARHNAELNGLTNCVFTSGEAHKSARGFAGNPQLVVLDPPRAGLAPELTKTLLLKKIPCLIYVSCSPDTLARDLKLLSEKYDLQFVQGLDMFPHTHHLETVAALTRRG